MTDALLQPPPRVSASPPRLVVACFPFPDESAAGFLQRCCETNMLPKSRDLLNLVETTCGVSLPGVPEVALSHAALESLACIAGAPPACLASQAIQTLDGATGKFLRQGLHTWPEDARLSDVQQVCPACLSEAQFAHLAWEFVQAPVCLVHSVALLSACPECHKPLRFSRTALGRCGTCGHDLARAVTTSVGAEALAAGVLVQTPRMVGLGAPQSDAPIDALELSALLRLCLLPHLGEPVDFGLDLRLDRYPTERRLDALHLLGTALSKGRLDSSVLRSTLLRRWPYAFRLPAEEQTLLLVSACRRVELSQEVHRLVCHGTDAEPYASAAEEFAGRPPRIFELENLATHLGVDAAMLGQLMAVEHVCGQPAPGMGYDMDEVLRMRRALKSLWTVKQADAALGCPGLTNALVTLKVLDAVLAEGEVQWLRPAEVEALFARLHQCVAVSDSNADAVALSTANTLNFDLGRIAWAVSQALTGSLRVFGWDSPYGLMDLRVDAARLLQLADWPKSENGRRS